MSGGLGAYPELEGSLPCLLARCISIAEQAGSPCLRGDEVARQQPRAREILRAQRSIPGQCVSSKARSVQLLMR